MSSLQDQKEVTEANKAPLVSTTEQINATTSDTVGGGDAKNGEGDAKNREGDAKNGEGDAKNSDGDAKKTPKQSRKNKRRSLNREKNNSKILLDSDVWADIRTVWHLKHHHKTEDVLGRCFSLDDTIIKEFKFFNRGLVVGIEEDQFRLAMFFHPFVDMTESERQEYQAALDYMRQDVEYHEQITTNAAANAAGQAGKMYGVGWRGGTTHGQAFGLYSPNGRKVTEEEWRKHMEASQKVAALYKTWFKRLSKYAFEQTQQGAYNMKVPALGETKWILDELTVKKAFASNMTFTYDDFSNVSHNDNDVNEFTAGAWFPVYKETFKLAEKKDGFGCDGGQFIWAEYGVGADFPGHDGITWLIWRGRFDVHCTLRAKARPGFTLVGTSVQIHEKLAAKVSKYLKEMSITTNIVNDVDAQCSTLKKKK